MLTTRHTVHHIRRVELPAFLHDGFGCHRPSPSARELRHFPATSVYYCPTWFGRGFASAARTRCRPSLLSVGHLLLSFATKLATLPATCSAAIQAHQKQSCQYDEANHLPTEKSTTLVRHAHAQAGRQRSWRQNALGRVSVVDFMRRSQILKRRASHSLSSQSGMSECSSSAKRRAQAVGAKSSTPGASSSKGTKRVPLGKLKALNKPFKPPGMVQGDTALSTCSLRVDMLLCSQSRGQASSEDTYVGGSSPTQGDISSPMG